MANLTIHTPQAADAAELVADMRPLDRAEVIASAGENVYDAVLTAIRASDLGMTVRLGGKLAAIAGVVPISLVSGSAQPWMLGTSQMRTLGRPLGLIARRYIAEASRDYPLLFNHVDARNAPSIRLIQWLGFAIEPARPLGRAGLPFHRFQLRSDPDPCASVQEPPT